jgi:hypothetical protein
MASFGNLSPQVADWVFSLLSEKFAIPVNGVSASGSLAKWGYPDNTSLANLTAEFNRHAKGTFDWRSAWVTPSELIDAVNGKAVGDLIDFLSSVVDKAIRSTEQVLRKEFEAETERILEKKKTCGAGSPLFDQVRQWTTCNLTNNNIINDLEKWIFPGEGTNALNFVRDFNGHAATCWKDATIQLDDLKPKLQHFPPNIGGLIDHLYRVVLAAFKAVTPIS